MTARGRALLVVFLAAIGCIGFVASASAASSAKTCKTVIVATHVNHRTIRRHVRVCETAAISLSATSVPYSGGQVTIRFTSTQATTCTLGSSPAFWAGRNPTPVRCRGSYIATVPATNDARQWTFRFLVRNRYKQVVAVARVLVEQANPVPIQFSSNWSGYVLEGTGLNGAQGTFNVPNLSPTVGRSVASEWVGVDGNSNSSLIQAGVHEGYDPVSNTVLIYAWWEILPFAETPIGSMVVSPGDSVTATVQQLSGTTWQISVVDNTTAQSFVTDRFYNGPETSAEWIVEAPTVSGSTAQLGVYSPNVTFSGLAAVGNRVLLDQLFMVQNNGIVSSPSALDANGFTVAYGPNPPSAP